jgi:predicted short-subunit dehydrogenase-like oxidoreductase (DUF2520 family)
MGSAVAGLLLDAGLAPHVTLIGRSPSPPDVPILRRPGVSYRGALPGPAPAGGVVILAVPDAAVAQVAAALAAQGATRDATALHLSGALPAAVLAPLAPRGYATASLHPLQTVAEPGATGAPLRGIAFGFEGAAAARPVAEQIVRAAGGRMLDVEPAAKPLYHAACVFASNYVVATVAVGVRLLARATGVPQDRALGALLPLVEGARANLERVGLPHALTGPVARGDVEVVARHLAALDAPTRALYSAWAREALRLARAAGLEPRRAREIERLLDREG